MRPATFNRIRAALMALLAMAAALLTLAGMSGPALAQEQQPSYYQPFKGEPFFLLSDTAYGSAEEALVRLEVPGRDMARANLQAYSGVDILLYRVPAPLEFLKKQPNLHRIQLEGNFRGEGLANTLSYLWDTWWKQSRQAWRKLFSSAARQAVTTTQPALATNNEALTRPTEFRNHPQYKPLKGFDLVDRFRYPLWEAKPIEPPKDVKLDGSSSEFTPVTAGNVMIPLGKRKPGLYLVEAIIGEHRATTLVFVSDTMAVTKVSSNQMVVWTARRDNGAVVPDVNVAWTDGTGVLQSGRSGGDGVAMLERGSPEHTYLMGEDSQGGVFVSENFYYDSEIYNTKIYAVTDRPLYRPGDEVNVKFIGRNFTSARTSTQAAPGPVALTVFDPNGTPLLTQALQLSGATGADTRFKLPPQASAGGYELRFSYQGDQYGAAFRVAEYVKPHFEIAIVPSKPEFKTGDAVSGRIELRYPDGKPVKHATLSLALRSQKNTMVEGELRYSGLFPVQLKTEQLETDGDGGVAYSLPAAADPSRYILTVLATDGAAYRVKATRELMIERSATVYRLKSEQLYSKPGDTVHFELLAEGTGDSRPVRWEMIQLEKQTKTTGPFDPAAKSWDVKFDVSGSYQLRLRDKNDNLLAARSHWVSGDGVAATPGSIEIVFDRERYRAGDTAQALITFAEPVEQALLTLERDKVEQVGLLAGGAGWVKPVRIAPNQWRAAIPVKDDYGPNITFSVAYTRRGDFVFQNQGLQIIEPRIALQFKTDKEVYQPGEQVTLDVTATLEGKPVSTMVALGVVDEMIYVLQPEIAPDMGDFFYHPRRNNVRTTASMSFISYDLAQGRSAGAPARHNYNERGVKVLERPRRDDVDTAFWAPTLQTDASGRVRVTFTMPDALTRWRITGRAMDSEGRVGQRTGFLRSDKTFYAKWAAPDWMRSGDAPVAPVALFNQGASDQALEVTLSNVTPAGGKTVQTEKITAKRGINYVHFPLAAGSGALHLEVHQGGKLVDSLDTRMQTMPAAWLSSRVQQVALGGASTPLKLPADARNIRLSFAQGAASHFSRIADDLIVYPYGCVEQTSSRLIPLALALQSMGPEAGRSREAVLATLQAERLRLVAMAGPDALFGWWGNATEGSALMTAYAYYADWYAARALKIALPPEHWQRLLDTYQKLGPKEAPLSRALILWMAQEMGLPVATLASGLADELATLNPAAPVGAQSLRNSMVLSQDDNARPLTVALLSVVAKQAKVALAPELQAESVKAWESLRTQQAPLVQALRLLDGKLSPAETDKVLAATRADMPTLDRALTLVWVQRALGVVPNAKESLPAVGEPWQKSDGLLGQPQWRWPEGKGVPAQLDLAQAPAGMVAVLQYDSRVAEASSLPVQLQRRIVRLNMGKDGFTPVALGAGEALRTDQLYMDEITLTAAPGAIHRYGLLEVALPPGAAVESGTWGVNIVGAKTAPLERARHESRRDGYIVPIEPLSGTVTVRHLLRFAQKGSYVLPPARFSRIYQPEQKAFEGDGKTARALKVE
ncbi:alpha-2-macroglobulin family protein [Oxalobacteraceae bacterium]|nr:alpha-2-macroglobulin family protein [Oxalobacteraceae bacterium]